MILRGVLLATTTLAMLLVACDASDLGTRYRAERELAHADRIRNHVSRRDQATLASLLARYESIGARYEKAARSSPREDEIRNLAGEAWLRCAGLRHVVLDSLGAAAILDTIAIRFADMPAVAAEVAWTRARIAELHGDLDVASDHTRRLLTLVRPDPLREGPQRAAFEAPLRLARWAASSGPETPDIAIARAFYDSLAQSASMHRRIEASRHLAEVEALRGHGARARSLLDSVATYVAERRVPLVSSHRMRVQAFSYDLAAWRRGDLSDDELEQRHASLLRSLERHRELAASTLLERAEVAESIGRSEIAREYLERLRHEHPYVSSAPEALLLEARILARARRITEAALVYRILWSRFPLDPIALGVPLDMDANEDLGGHIDVVIDGPDAIARTYRDLLRRYPTGPHEIPVRTNLVEALSRAGRLDEAVEEQLVVARRLHGRAEGPGALARAAELADTLLGDPERSAAILEELASTYPSTRLGRRAAVRAALLRQKQP